MLTESLPREILETFRDEARSIYERVTAALLELERPDAAHAEIYTNIARELHTLKGSAGTCGMDELSKLGHVMEDLLAQTRQDEGALPAVAADALLRALDLFVHRAASTAEGKPDAPDLAPAFAAVAAAQRGESVAAANDPADGKAPVEDGDTWNVRRAQVRDLEREAERLRQLRLRLHGRIEELDEILTSLGRGAHRLDVGELRARMSTLRYGLVFDRDDTGTIASGVSDGLKSIAALPVARVTGPLARTVREVCRVTGKRARLSVVGGEISIDRQVLSVMNGVFVHLIRNAIDHGLELPEERDKAGKHSEGELTIRIEQHGNIVMIELSDDGRGLDVAKIGRVAVARGVVSPEALETMSRAEIHRLIFSPGLSTSDGVSETSGRGVGLDAVLEAVRSMGGEIDVISQQGSGTRFVITVTVEMGTSPTLVVRVGEHLLGIPMGALNSIIGARRDRMQISRSRVVLEHEGQLLSVIDLGARLGLREFSAPSEGQPLLLVQAQGTQAAIVVDEIRGDWELAMRGLPTELASIRAYRGVAAAAHGEPLLILRPEWLVAPERRDRPTAAPPRALVVDDSITARAAHRTMLEAGGFEVHTATGGMQALQRMRADRYDIAIVDIRMHDLNGMELTARLREDPRTRGVPIVIVSADDRPQLRDEAIAAGADGFIPKRDCEAGRLLSEVERALTRRGVR